MTEEPSQQQPEQVSHRPDVRLVVRDVSEGLVVGRHPSLQDGQHLADKVVPHGEHEVQAGSRRDQGDQEQRSGGGGALQEHQQRRRDEEQLPLDGQVPRLVDTHLGVREQVVDEQQVSPPERITARLQARPSVGGPERRAAVVPAEADRQHPHDGHVRRRQPPVSLHQTLQPEAGAAPRVRPGARHPAEVVVGDEGGAEQQERVRHERRPEDGQRPPAQLGQRHHERVLHAGHVVAVQQRDPHDAQRSDAVHAADVSGRGARVQDLGGVPSQAEGGQQASQAAGRRRRRRPDGERLHRLGRFLARGQLVVSDHRRSTVGPTE